MLLHIFNCKFTLFDWKNELNENLLLTINSYVDQKYQSRTDFVEKE